MSSRRARSDSWSTSVRGTDPGGRSPLRSCRARAGRVGRHRGRAAGVRDWPRRRRQPLQTADSSTAQPPAGVHGRPPAGRLRPQAGPPAARGGMWSAPMAQLPVARTSGTRPSRAGRAAAPGHPGQCPADPRAAQRPGPRPASAGPAPRGEGSPALRMELPPQCSWAWAPNRLRRVSPWSVTAGNSAMAFLTPVATGRSPGQAAERIASAAGAGPTGPSGRSM